ncbi:aminotransferase class V-fold PLP-dependent enzyme [Microbulbifer sediminum]|uniref:aminotransferase class V-fold PLP-dependent enzyme n=1 Tax=Microbulbifer sediminum TaxID=2904250 RepID=UPI001F17B543|nr:aminotransferase class V-fold PLP-dependent enzyme [Microbulbifer sediminum]
MYQKYYRQFLQGAAESAASGAKAPLHMACHSHHYWPDITLEAVQQYWQDSARLADSKWGPIFEQKIPAWQAAVARVLNLPAPDRIALAPNTHELVFRLISAFDLSRPLRILTTDGEFYSFTRQLQRLEEEANVEVTRIHKEPYDTLAERFEQELHHGHYELAYASQVFFDSGIAFPDLAGIAGRKPERTEFVIDGYHGYFARPTDLGEIADKVFYTAGSYKYQGAGEGLCFMSIPAGCTLRPLYTGWFADMAELENRADQVGFADNWLRFAGSTMDYSTLYKAVAILELFEREGITVEKIHEYVRGRQQQFLATMDSAGHPLLNRQNLIYHDLERGHGHFFTFDCTTAQRARQLQEELLTRGVLCDRRQQLLRLGFAIYQDENETFQRVFS